MCDFRHGCYRLRFLFVDRGNLPATSLLINASEFIGHASNSEMIIDNYVMWLVKRRKGEEGGGAVIK